VTLIFLSCPRCAPPWFIEHIACRSATLAASGMGVPATAIVARPAEAGSIGASMGLHGGPGYSYGKSANVI